MKTKITKKNPFKCGRYAFAFEHIKEKSRYLDYGCFDGRVIYEVKRYNNVEYIGADKNKDIILENPYNQNIFYFKDYPLPFENKYFNGVTILDVIEHIYDQDTLLKEINRILVRGGI